MAKINVREKGKGYELKTAKLLSPWWGETFRRTPCSGALKWGTDQGVAGDIVTPEGSLFPFSIECKHREGWSIEQLMKGSAEIESWWSQCVTDSDRVGLKPLVIFHKNFSPNYAMIRTEDFMPILSYKERLPITTMIINVVGKESRVIFILDEFIKFVSKDDILKAYSI